LEIQRFTQQLGNNCHRIWEVEDNDRGPYKGMGGDALMGEPLYHVDERLVYNGF
jgi:hypothetical protein